jgi:hypothetical protein
MRKIAPPPPHLLLFLLALGYWIYLLGRAWHIPVTHDEAATSLLLSKHNYTQLVFYRYDYISANNHVLNSLLAKFFSDLSGGLSPLSIRAGNLLAAIAYLGAGGVLIRLVFQSKWLRPWRERQRERAILSNVTLGLALLIVLPISRIKKAGDFTWFGNNGFFKDTVQGFLDCFLLGKHCFGPNTLVYLQILLVVLFAISSIAAGVLVWKNRGKITPLAWLVGLFQPPC